MKYTREYKIKLCDMGLDFRAKQKSILGYFQECFAEWCLVHKMTGYHLAQKGLMWVITNINMENLGEMPFWSEDIRVEVWFSEVKKLRAYLEFRIFCGNRPVAQGDSCWMVLEQQTRRPVAIDKIVENCGIENEKNFLLRKRLDNDAKGELVNEVTFKATYSDLDYNGHVNNLSYLMWGVESLPENFRNSHKVKNCSLVFHRECFLNDEIQTQMYRDGDNFNFLIKRKNDDEIACMVEIETVESQQIPVNELAALMS